MPGFEKIGYYFITDSTITTVPVLKQAEAVLDSGLGIKFIQYREKSKPIPVIREELAQLKSILPSSVFLILNDYAELALELCDGVHVGEDDIPVQQVLELAKSSGRKDFILGASATTISSVLLLNQFPISYIGFGPVFATTTKHNAAEPTGLEALRQAILVSKHPVVAIGGISQQNLDSVLELRPSGVAAISLVLKKSSLDFSHVRKIQQAFVASRSL